MKEAEAIEIAKAHVIATRGMEPKLLGAKKSPRHPSEWNMMFETILPDGQVMDDPTIVIVDENTRKTQYFPSL